MEVSPNILFRYPWVFPTLRAIRRTRKKLGKNLYLPPAGVLGLLLQRTQLQTLVFSRAALYRNNELRN